MKIRRTIALIAATATMTGGALASLAPAAGAATSGNTVISASLVAGVLSITTPAPTAVLGSGAVGSVNVGTVLTGSLGTTTVDDGRGSLAGWTVTALTTTASMSDGATPTPHTIALSATGPLSLVTGTITATGGSILGSVAAGAGGNLNMSTPVTVATAPLSSGGGSYTFNPTVTLTVPANAVAGTYTVTVTQTVA